MSSRVGTMRAAADGSDPGAMIAAQEGRTAFPSADDEAFAGWGVMGLPFSSGDYLALRRFPASSIGPAFSSVWWRDPHNRWTMFTSVAAELSCPRYFSRALAAHEMRDIHLAWSGPYALRISIPDVLDWQITLGSSVATRAMSAVGAAMPGSFWRNPVSLALIGQTARLTLRVGNVSLRGLVPNSQWFQASPRRVWHVQESRAILRGRDLGVPAPLPTQTRLGDLWLPQQGIFFVGEAHLESLNPARHCVTLAQASAAVGRAFGQATGGASE